MKIFGIDINRTCKCKIVEDLINSTEHGKYYENIAKLDDWEKKCLELNFRIKKGSVSK